MKKKIEVAIGSSSGDTVTDLAFAEFMAPEHQHEVTKEDAIKMINEYNLLLHIDKNLVFYAPTFARWLFVWQDKTATDEYVPCPTCLSASYDCVPVPALCFRGVSSC